MIRTERLIISAIAMGVVVGLCGAFSLGMVCANSLRDGEEAAWGYERAGAPRAFEEDLYRYKAKVVRVIDGDTIDVQIDLGMDISVKRRLRLARIDTPEMRVGKAGEEARSFVVGAASGVELRVQISKVDSFGRYLAEVWHPVGERDNPVWVNLNDELVEKGFARRYEK